MVLYFSATGNTKYIAEELARILDDSALDLREKIRQKDYTPIRSEKPFVICSPVYVGEPPVFLVSYMRKTRLTGSPYVYCIFTNGGYSGISDFIFRCLMRKKSYKGSVDILMPNNYIATSLIRQTETVEIERRIKEAEKKIPEIAASIRSGDTLRTRHISFLEILATLPFVPVWYRLCQGVRGFHVSNACISCGKCEKLCPLQVIRMQNGKPVWSGRSCAHCMSCIQNCPVEAIEYGKVTRGRNRYRFEKYKRDL